MTEKTSQGEPARGRHVPFSGRVQAHTPGEAGPLAPIAMEGTGENGLAAGGRGIRTVDPARSRPSPALSYSLGPKHPILCQRVFSLSISYPDLGFVLDHGTKVQFIGFRCAGFEAARALEFYGFCKEGTALDFIQDGRIEHDG